MRSDDIRPATANAAAKPLRRGPGARLTAAVQELAQEKARVVSHSETNWASITFAGTRHRYVLEFEGPRAVEAGECFIVFLPEHEFTVPGQLVADAVITQVDHQLDPPLMRVACELLLLEEG